MNTIKIYSAKKIFNTIKTHLILIVVCLFFLFPLIVLLTTSFKTDEEIYTYPISLFSKSLQLTNYTAVFKQMPFVRYYWNTIYITLLSILGTVLVCPLVAFAFARLKWPGRNILFFITLGVMMIPYHVTVIPVFIIFIKMKMVGTFWPLILPRFFGTPFFIFLLRQFMMGLPKDLEDAAYIDGCTTFQIYKKIFVPLSKAAILTIVIFTILQTWNDFLGPLIYLRNEGMFTLQLGLSHFKSEYQVNYPGLMAASVMISAPVMLLFFFLQKHFIEGITFTGIKG